VPHEVDVAIERGKKSPSPDRLPTVEVSSSPGLAFRQGIEFTRSTAFQFRIYKREKTSLPTPSSSGTSSAWTWSRGAPALADGALAEMWRACSACAPLPCRRVVRPTWRLCIAQETWQPRSTRGLRILRGERAVPFQELLQY